MLPLPDSNILKFKDYHKSLRKPVVVYADFECLLKPTAEVSGKTEKNQRHVPCSYGYVVAKSCCGPPSFGAVKIYRGEDCSKRFVQEMAVIAEQHNSAINNFMLLSLSDNEELAFLQAKDCMLCKKTATGRPSSRSLPPMWTISWRMS